MVSGVAKHFVLPDDDYLTEAFTALESPAFKQINLFPSNMTHVTVVPDRFVLTC